jgi:hypothetical protein
MWKPAVWLSSVIKSTKKKGFMKLVYSLTVDLHNDGKRVSCTGWYNDLNSLPFHIEVEGWFDVET